MATRGRLGLSKLEKADLWDRWKRGESLSETARALAKNPGSMHSLLRGKDGVAPPPRRRCPKALKPSEREEMSRLIAAGLGVREIAMAIGRTPPTPRTTSQQRQSQISVCASRCSCLGTFKRWSVDTVSNEPSTSLPIAYSRP